MSLPVLKAIHELVLHGAVVVGAKPTDDPSLADDQSEFRMLADRLFGDGTGEHRVGQGVVYAGTALEDVLRKRSILPDFDYRGAQDATEIGFLHRSIPGGEIYFLSNRSDKAQEISATFRVAGRVAELWEPETGAVKEASFESHDGRTTVPINLGPSGSVFVVFRKATKSSIHPAVAVEKVDSLKLDGAWDVAFQAGRGAPASITMQQLMDWSTSQEDGVKYFSGAATYTKSVNLPRDWFDGRSHFLLSLGEVKNLAVVTINGKRIGTAWHAPFELDATGAVKPGLNKIEVWVTNAWVNRMIGDEQPRAVRYTWADVNPYTAASPLMPSGLLGPVTLFQEHAR